MLRAATLGFLALAGCAGPAPPAPPPADEPVDLAIVGGAVLNPDGTSIEDAIVTIDDGTIVSVEPRSTRGHRRAKRTIDATGRHVMPGLVDAHVHLGLGGIAPRTSSTVVDTLALFVYHGVTTVFVVGGSGAGDEDATITRRAAAADRANAPAILSTGAQLTVAGSHPVATIFRSALPPTADPEAFDWRPFGVEMVATPDEARQAVRRKAAAGFDGIKVVVETGPAPFGNEHPLLGGAVLAAAASAAREARLGLFVHATDATEIAAAMDAGARAIMHAPAEEPFPDDALVARMAREGTHVVSTLAAFDGFFRYLDEPERLADPFLRAGVAEATVASLAHPGFQAGHATTADAMREAMPRIRQTIGRMFRAGIPIVAGTDTNNPYAFPGHAMHRELELLTESGLDARDALAAATVAPAAMLQRPGLGAIGPGAPADVLVLDGDPREDIRNTRRIAAVISGGRVVDRADIRRRLGLADDRRGAADGASTPDLR